MIAKRLTLCAAALLASVVLPSAAAAQQACPSRPAAEQAVQSGDYSASAEAFEQIAVEAGCDAAFIDWMSRALWQATIRHAQAEEDLALRDEWLRASLRYRRDWKTYAMLGDLAAERDNRNDEAYYLQQAMNVLNADTTQPATDAELAMLVARAQTAVLLADTVIPEGEGTRGEPGGIFTGVRGFGTTETPLPIEFVTGSTEFTPKGAGYAEKLLGYLQRTATPKIVLEGHTDPRGDAAYNMQLSMWRAEALRAYLTGAGYSGEIALVARGETEVPPPPPGIAAGSAEHFQIARRVVLIR